MSDWNEVSQEDFKETDLKTDLKKTQDSGACEITYESSMTVSLYLLNPHMHKKETSSVGDSHTFIFVIMDLQNQNYSCRLNNGKQVWEQSW